MNRPSTLRVLVIAEACNPAWTSVPLVGYNVARALASRGDLDVTLATHPRNRPDLEADSLAKRARIFYPDNEYVAKRAYDFAQWLRGGKGAGWTTNTAFLSLSYLFFERELYQLLGEQIDIGVFDIIHRVTPVTPTIGSPLSTWTDTPMVLGPLNGGLPWPDAYPELRGQEKEYFAPLRRVYKHLPYYHATYDRARAVICGSQHTLSELPDHFDGQRYLIPENGVDPHRFPGRTKWSPPQGRFRFVTVGRLVPYKGLHLTLQAMRDSPAMKECELVIIGDGPARQELTQRAADYGLASQVMFRGHLPQVDIARELAAAQCFIFPSLREFGGGVVLEAMNSCLPSIVVRYGGPVDLLDDDCGILLPMQPERPLVGSIRSAMERLATDHALCRQFGERAASRVRQHFTWEAKAEKFVDIYHRLLEPSPCPQRIPPKSATSASMS